MLLYQDDQRGLATCPSINYLIDTCSASAVYGKWQLPSGKLVYFDTFITAGGGMTGSGIGPAVKRPA